MRHDPFNTLLGLEIAGESLLDRFPPEGACRDDNGRFCHVPTTVTLDKNVFGGRYGGTAMELITLIGFALSGKEEHYFEELDV